MKIALAQINPTVGDFEGNVRLIRRFLKKVQKADATLLLFEPAGGA